MSQLIDLELLKKIRNESNEESLNDLIRRYLPMIRYIVRNKNISFNDFDDFFQEGTIALLKAIRLYDEENYEVKFSTFVYLCISRRICNCLRSIQSGKSRLLTSAVSLETEGFHISDDSRNEPARRVEEYCSFQRLKIFLQKMLSPLEYRVVLLAFYGYRQAEISEILRVSIKAIDNAKTRAKGKIRKHFDDVLLHS